jgi:hypothetical protein
MPHAEQSRNRTCAEQAHEFHLEFVSYVLAYELQRAEKTRREPGRRRNVDR